ncbi:MBL fold metallo-hydrolase [Candidatus Curtissbacteria bacterium]|nr:MBL fold metallo-hydrolase [Candidatus Curtissbacteria bacterium]
MILKFNGACREVTGSCVLVESGESKILLECGFFQGSSLAEDRNKEPFLFDPKTINALIVCHAHLDHVGRIPKLVKEGFAGKIFSTAPTKEIAQLVLQDTYKLMAEDAKRKKGEVIYDLEDVNAAVVLGSAFAVLELEGKRLVYTSDLGNVPSELLSPPETVDQADIVICESTYGSRVHEDISTRQEKLNAILSSTITSRGVLLIPAFAIERTQELLHDIEHFCINGKCALPNFFLDSPLAEKVTEVFKKYPEYLNKNLFASGEDADVFALKRIKITGSAKESREIDDATSPKIIIAGSGMMNGGRILFHLQKYLEDANNAVLIVGFQAKGTLGRRLLDGDKQVKIFGKEYNVNAKILAIGSYSAHADSKQLIAWLSKISGLSKAFLVHGEVSEAEGLAASLRTQLQIEVDMPQLGEEYQI